MEWAVFLSVCLTGLTSRTLACTNLSNYGINGEVELETQVTHEGATDGVRGVWLVAPMKRACGFQMPSHMITTDSRGRYHHVCLTGEGTGM